MENDSVPRMRLAPKISYLKCKMRQTAAPSPRLRPKRMILISKSPYRVAQVVVENLPLIKFRPLVGHYCGFLLPRQNDVTSQI